MANTTEDLIKYFLFGLAAVGIPSLIAKFPLFTSWLGNITFLTTPYWGITLLSVVYAGLGVLLVDQLFFK